MFKEREYLTKDIVSDGHWELPLLEVLCQAGGEVCSVESIESPPFRIRKLLQAVFDDLGPLSY